MEQFAFEEAVTHFQRAVELLEWDDPPGPWAKSAMTVQATVSLVVIGLVVARAVNVLA